MATQPGHRYTVHLVRFGFQHSGDRDADEDMNVDLLQLPSKANLVAWSARVWRKVPTFRTRVVPASAAKVHSVYIVVDLVAPNYKASTVFQRRSQPLFGRLVLWSARKWASETLHTLLAWQMTRTARLWPVLLWKAARLVLVGLVLLSAPWPLCCSNLHNFTKWAK